MTFSPICKPSSLNNAAIAALAESKAIEADVSQRHALGLLLDQRGAPAIHYGDNPNSFSRFSNFFRRFSATQCCFRVIPDIPWAIFVVYTQPEMDSNEQNWVIAHELGHLFLHMSPFSPSREESALSTQFDHSADPLLDRQANRFALSLLMPEKPFRGAMAKNPSVDSAMLKFRAPQSVVTSRMKMLGI